MRDDFDWCDVFLMDELCQVVNVVGVDIGVVLDLLIVVVVVQVWGENVVIFFQLFCDLILIVVMVVFVMYQ